MKVAAIQLSATDNKEKNLDTACRLIEKSARAKAKLIVLPEVFNFRGKTSSPRELACISESTNGPTIKVFKALAKKYRACILAGSIYEKIPNTKKLYNTSVFIDHAGAIKGKYRKNNLFSARLSRQTITESMRFKAGTQKTVVNVFGLKMGLTICYDLRFPQMFQHYAQKGVDIICVPSAFTHETGKAHWEVLMKARAIEAQAYIIAPNQAGKDSKGIRCHGHSLIIDPWGKKLVSAKMEKEKIIYARVDKKVLKQTRKALPGFNKG